MYDVKSIDIIKVYFYLEFYKNFDIYLYCKNILITFSKLIKIQLMCRYYLKTTCACNLYSISITKLFDKVRKEQLEKFIIFNEDKKSYYNDLIRDIRKCFEEYWENFKDQKFVPGFYWYLTTAYSSHLKDLKIIPKANKISKEEDAITTPYNYFRNKGEAEKLLENLKRVFFKYGISLDKKI